MTGGIISRITGSGQKPKSKPPSRKGKAFWNKRQTKLPGMVKQVRGAQYPPLSAPSSSPVMVQPESKATSQALNQLNTSSTNTTKPSPTSTPTKTPKDPSEGGDDPPKKKETNPSPSPSSNSLSKRAQIFKLINEPTLDVKMLRKHSWSGLSSAVRNDTWQLILGYQPANRSRREPTVAKRRKEYQDHCKQYYNTDDTAYSSQEKKIMHQIRLDTPRTLPGFKLLQHKSIQLLLERILYIWSIRHPASGYVQGINDLVVPFFVVFLAARLGIEPAQLREKHLIEEDLNAIEADCFWCLSKLLDGIQDHYTSAQPGIQKMVFKLEELLHRLDQPLHQHLKKHEIRFFHFSYRWMNCLLMREVSLPLIIRLWDTYVAEPDGFKVFHIYVCAAMMKRFSSELLARKEFQDLILFLQNLPTDSWTEKDIETLLAQAYVYKFQFEGAENHLH